jgi:hypothetical protein
LAARQRVNGLPVTVHRFRSRRRKSAQIFMSARTDVRGYIIFEKRWIVRGRLKHELQRPSETAQFVRWLNFLDEQTVIKKLSIRTLFLTAAAVSILSLGSFATWRQFQAAYCVRVRPGPPFCVTCINNLRQINAAKDEWALENGKTNGTVCTASDITPYMKLDAYRNFPKCPSGGTYTIGKISELPTCSLGTNVNPPHVLP